MQDIHIHKNTRTHNSIHTHTHIYNVEIMGENISGKFKHNSCNSEIQKLFHKCKETDTDYNSKYSKKMFKTAAHKRIAFSKSRV